MAAFVSGVTAAAIGAITGAVVVLGRRSVRDIPTALFFCVTLGLMWRFKRIPKPIIVLSAAALGLIFYPLMQP